MSKSPSGSVVGFPTEPRGRPTITVAPRDRPPFAVEAVVDEDDTYHVLSAAPVFDSTGDHPLRVLDAAHNARPAPAGSVVVREWTPLRLLAVIHALDEVPSWRESWIADAYRQLFRECRLRSLRSLALPPLGTVHGRLDRDRSLELLKQSLETNKPRSLERIWLIDSTDECGNNA